MFETTNQISGWWVNWVPVHDLLPRGSEHPHVKGDGHISWRGIGGALCVAQGDWRLATLWLCQNSYWKCLFIVDFPIKKGDFP